MSGRVTKQWMFGFAGLFAGILVALASVVVFLSVRADTREEEQATLTAHRFTTPYLEIPGHRNADPHLKDAKEWVEEYVEARVTEDPTLRIGVYARDLLEGPWIGVGEEEAFQAASLMKVAVLIYTLHRMSLEPELERRRIVYPGPDSMATSSGLEGAPPEHRMTPGESYEIEELLHRMIVYSDNHAKDLLLEDVDLAEMFEFLGAHGVPVQVMGREPVVMVRSYSVLFRLLFNASVLSRADSEHALSMLSSSIFEAGLRAAVPSTVPVASKFGLRLDPTTRGGQLHECGILYLPVHPLLVCVMTSSGKDAASLPGIVRDIARELAEAKMRNCPPPGWDLGLLDVLVPGEGPSRLVRPRASELGADRTAWPFREEPACRAPLWGGTG